MLTATSSEFLLLSEKVNDLNNSFDWIVGGIGIVLTVVILLIGVIQILYTRRFTTQEIEELERKLKNTISATLDKEAVSLQSIVDQGISEMKREISLDRQSIEGQINRMYAIASEGKGFYATSFGWWLSAAISYNNAGRIDVFNLSLNRTKGALEKIIEGDNLNINRLWEKLSINEESLLKLSLTHPTESMLIKGLMMEKIKLSKNKVNINQSIS